MTAVDYSELSVEKAKAFNRAAVAAGRCEVRQGDAVRLDFPDETFDAVVSNCVYQSIPGDRQRYLLETLRTLEKAAPSPCTTSSRNRNTAICGPL